jgi:hypothetical protein
VLRHFFHKRRAKLARLGVERIFKIPHAGAEAVPRRFICLFMWIFLCRNCA